jgi:hypothetical protein
MNIVMAMDDAMIRNMKEKTVIKTPIDDVFTLIDVTTLESLVSSPNMNIKPSNQRPEQMTDIIRIFTLVDLERGDMLNLKSLERVEDA